jgi:hypothetical protein
MKLGALMLGEYRLIIVISFWCISPFISMECPSLSHLINVSLTSTLSEISIATPAFTFSSNSTPLLCVHFQFLIYCSVFFFFFFFLLGESFCQGGYAGLVYPRGDWCSSVGLLNVSQAGLKPVCQPSCFLSVTWCGEAFHGLGVQGVEVLILLAALLKPRVAPAS